MPPRKRAASVSAASGSPGGAGAAARGRGRGKARGGISNKSAWSFYSLPAASPSRILRESFAGVRSCGPRERERGINFTPMVHCQ
eukprot:450063-Alexandrium_andersonii.AAC.1